MIRWWSLLVLIIVAAIVLVALLNRDEDRWKRGRGYRCNYMDPAGRRCELDHLHTTDLCVTHDKYGGLHEWKGLNWEWDDKEKVFVKRPGSWKGQS